MIVEKGKLRNALNKISVFVDKEVNGVGSKILFTSKDGIASLIGCDGNNVGIFSFPVGETEEFAFVTEFKAMAAAASLRGDVKIDYKDGTVTISQGETSMVFPASDKDTFAFEEKNIEENNSIEIDSTQFKKLIAKVSYARKEKETRAFITGVNLSFDGTYLKSESTDALRLLKNFTKLENFGEVKFAGVLSPKCIKAIETMDDNKNITIKMNASAISFQADDMKIYMPMLNCSYPDSSKFFQFEKKATFVLDKEKVLESMEILALSENKAMFCKKVDNRILFSMEDGISDVKDKIDMESSEGENFEFTLDFEHFRDIFRNLKDGSKVTFIWSDSGSQIIFQDEVNLEGVVMPLRK